MRIPQHLRLYMYAYVLSMEIRKDEYRKPLKKKLLNAMAVALAGFLVALLRRPAGVAFWFWS